MLRIDQLRSYHCTHLVANLFAGTKDLYLCAHLLCIGNVSVCDPGDTLGVDILKIKLFSISQRCQDRNLTACIITLDICRRILLCIALILCIL